MIGTHFWYIRRHANSPEAIREQHRSMTIGAWLAIALGVLALVLPRASGIALSIVLGAIITAIGVAGTATFAMGRQRQQAWWAIILSILTVIGGLYLLLAPKVGVTLLAILLGIFLFIDGVLTMIAGSQLRHMTNTALLMLGGALSLVLSLIIFGMLGQAAWLIGIFLGIHLLFNGIAALLISNKLAA